MIKNIGLMAGRGLLVLAGGWLLIKLVIFEAGRLNSTLVFTIVNFTPLWVAGAVGLLVAVSAGTLGNQKKWLPSLIAAIIAVPAAATDPWASFSLGLGNKISLALRLLLLMLPIIIAAGYAYPGIIIENKTGKTSPESKGTSFLRILSGVILLALINLGVYLLIYWLILPRLNLEGI